MAAARLAHAIVAGPRRHAHAGLKGWSGDCSSGSRRRRSPSDLRTINKVSQNLHAELMLRRLGRQSGTGAIADGLNVVRTMLAQAGLRRTDYDFSDGSGMSTYNRVTPRGVVTLLRWAAGQPWGAAWRATFPIAGVDGTLARRFRGTALEGRLFAKTGSLNATNALSGYLLARSGRTLTFSILRQRRTRRRQCNLGHGCRPAAHRGRELKVDSGLGVTDL